MCYEELLRLEHADGLHILCLSIFSANTQWWVVPSVSSHEEKSNAKACAVRGG